MAGDYRGRRRFPDHHPYAAADLRAVQAEAARAGADVLVTTEKDWAKVGALPDAAAGPLPVWRLDVEARFAAGDDGRLVDLVERAIGRHRKPDDG